MRLIVFFDLPVETAQQRKSYRLFRKNLIKEGFLMLQESVYTKLTINDQAANSVVNRMRQYKPSEGLVQVLKVTEKQFATMATIVGKAIEHEELDTMEDLILL